MSGDHFFSLFNSHPENTSKSPGLEASRDYYCCPTRQYLHIVKLLPEDLAYNQLELGTKRNFSPWNNDRFWWILKNAVI